MDENQEKFDIFMRFFIAISQVRIEAEENVAREALRFCIEIFFNGCPLLECPRRTFFP